MKWHKILFFILLVSMHTSVSAALVEIFNSGEISQTVTGQRFEFNNISAPFTDGKEAVLTLRARGNYSLGQAIEHIAVTMDNAVNPVSSVFTQIGNFDVDTADNILGIYGTEDTEWEINILLGSFFMDMYTADDSINLALDLSDFVDLSAMGETADQAYVSAVLSYNVIPVPATFWLLSLSILSVAYFKRNAYK